MKRSIAAALAVIFIAIPLRGTGAPAAGGGGTLPPDAVISERLYGLAGLSNMGRISPGVYRGAQPESAGYRTLQKMGIRTVINLRSRHGERALVEQAGMKSIEIPMSASAGVPLDRVEQVVAIMADPANRPVFVHCLHGKDRTGAVAAIYRMKIDGWTQRAAEAEMQSFGFNDIFFRLKRLVRSYSPGGGK